MPSNIENGKPDRIAHKLAGDLNAIALRCGKRPIVSQLCDDEILGYDESGAPMR